jgi:hypothetical protein
MSIVRGIGSLVLVMAFFIALLHQFVPHSTHTPSGAMEKVIELHDDKAWKGRDSLTDDALHRNEADGGPRRTLSPLEIIITGSGYPCEGVTNAAPIPNGDGGYWIWCRTPSGEARYAVDMRRNTAAPA